MRRCVSLACLALAFLLLSLPYARAGNAALEVRLGSGLFSDISTLVLAQLPNLTQAILPLPLPGQNNSVLNIKADIYDVALVDLQVPSVEVSIDPSAGFSLVMCAHPAPHAHVRHSYAHTPRDGITLRLNYTLTYQIWPASAKTLPNLQATASDVEVGVTFTLTAPVPRISIFQDSEYSFVHVGKLDLGIHDRYDTWEELVWRIDVTRQNVMRQAFVSTTHRYRHLTRCIHCRTCSP